MDVTIKDVAKAAGVSVATVSRVINGNLTVNEKLRKKVLDQVELLGFRPNLIARGLKCDVTNTIGIAVSDISNSFFIHIVREIEKSVRKKGYIMLMVSTDSDREKEFENIRMMNSKKVDGMIICPDSDDIEFVLKDVRCPVVAIDRKILKNLYDSVYVDKDQATYDIVQFLQIRGHKKIALVTGEKRMSSNFDRFNGYVRAHYDCGIDVVTNNIYFGNFSVEYGKQAFEEIASRDERPTAIVAGNALIAMGILIKAKEYGLKIPDDISLISFGEVELEGLIDKKITYIESHRTKIGQIAGEMMINRLEKPDQPVKTVILNAKIIEGDSVRTLI